MGLTKKAKVLLAVIAVFVITTVIVVSLLVFTRHTNIETEARNRLKNIDKSLQRSLEKMLDLVEQEEGRGTRRQERDINTIELRDLAQSVDQLTRSLSEFTEILNESKFPKIIARFQQDLLKYDQLLTEIQISGVEITSRILEQIKIQETAFNEDEADIFKIESISRKQAALIGPVILGIEAASNKTKEVLISEENNNIAPVAANDDEYTTGMDTLATESSDEDEISINTEADTTFEISTSIETTMEASKVNTEVIDNEDLPVEMEGIGEQVEAEEIVNTNIETSKKPMDDLNHNPEDEDIFLDTEENTIEIQSAGEEVDGEQEHFAESIETKNNIDYNSDDENIFQTPNQTPELSDFEY